MSRDWLTVEELAMRGLDFESRARVTALEPFVGDAPELAAHAIVVLLELCARNGIPVAASEGKDGTDG